MGIPAGLIAHNAAVGACEKAGQWEASLSVMKQLRDEGIHPDFITYAAAMRYARTF